MHHCSIGDEIGPNVQPECPQQPLAAVLLPSFVGAEGVPWLHPCSSVLLMWLWGGQVTPALGAELRASLLSAAFKNK